MCMGVFVLVFRMPDGKRAVGFYRSERGRLPRTPTEDAPPFSGDFAPVLARMGPRPIKARPFEPKACLRGDEEAGARSGPVENPRVHSQPEGGSVPPTAYVRTVMAVFAILWLHVGAWYPKRGRTGQKTV